MQNIYKCVTGAAMMFVICLSFVFLPQNTQTLLADEEAEAKAFIEKYKTAQIVTGKTLLNESSSFKKKNVLLVGKFQKEGYPNPKLKFMTEDFAPDGFLFSVECNLDDWYLIELGTITLAAYVERLDKAMIISAKGEGYIMVPKLKYLGHYTGDITKLINP